METTDTIQLNSTDLESLIRRKIPFAIYRLPGQRLPSMIEGRQEGVTLSEELAELDGQSGFIMAPFHITPSHPIVRIRPEGAPRRVELPQMECRPGRRSYAHKSPSETYCECFEVFKTALAKGDFSKLVLSRRMTLARAEGFPLWEVYARACRQYPDSYVFLCYTPTTGVWLGSTPEVILSGNGRHWLAVALAGTQPLAEGTLPTAWSLKNREEQGYVASYIRDLLRREGYFTTEEGPYTVKAGALAHLKTEFHFRMSDTLHLGQLLRQLHPTPAVCGLPKTAAGEFILANEGYDRGYYSGFVGMLSTSSPTDLYVNLRCMNITDKALHLYAGGGLVASSELDDEWQETENKLQTMLNII